MERPRKGRELSHEVTRPQLRAERRKTERLPGVNDVRQLPRPQKPLLCICRSVRHAPSGRFPTETISRILINRIGTGCLKCPPLLSPLRCIWGRKHYAPTASGAFVMNGISSEINSKQLLKIASGGGRGAHVSHECACLSSLKKLSGGI